MTNEEFISWLEEQAVWIKDATLTFYETGAFTEKDIKRFATDCIEEALGTRKKIDISNLKLLSRDERSNFSIRSIDNVIGVNALASGKTLEFGKSGVTVVYGENGAGKSGYIRILKKLADAKYKEDLWENVYTEKGDRQFCSVTVMREGTEETFNCDLSKAGEYSLLKDVDIFDTRISKAYVEASKEASYEPWVFTLLSAIAKVAADVKIEIEEMKNRLESVQIEFPEDIVETGECQEILRITENTEIDGIDFEWNETMEDALIQKERQANVEAITVSIQNLEREMKHLVALRNYIAQFECFFSKRNVDEIMSASRQLKLAEEELSAAKLLFENSAGDLDKRSVSNQAWINLWKSAQKYYDTFLKGEGVTKYTSMFGTCPLCGQAISDEESISRMLSVNEYVNGKASEQVANRRSFLISLLQKCPVSWEREQCELYITSASVEHIAKNIDEVVNKISVLSKLIHSGEKSDIEVSEIDIESLLVLIDDSIKEKEQWKQKQIELIGDEDHKRLIGEIKALKAKKYVSTIRDKVVRRISYLKEISLLNMAEKYTATNKISKQSTMLAKELLTDDYEKRFNDELKLLTKGSVKAVIRQQKASRGKIPFKVELEGVEDKSASPSDVLSEGESRVVSLAAFFAESSGRNAKCPLIVDDPISSLDYRYELSVIRRLIEAGKHRQVIVFTHRLSMVVGLYDECGKEVPFTEVELLGNGKNKGVPIASSVNGGKSLSKLRNLKSEKIAQLKKKDENSPEYTEGIHYVCQQIRIHVEKSVEDTLLYGIVLRHRKSVQTQGKIMWLSKITQDDCKIIDDMMTKYSYYDHSMSDEAPLQEFTLEEIEQDVDSFIAWLENVGSRQKEK